MKFKVMLLGLTTFFFFLLPNVVYAHSINESNGGFHLHKLPIVLSALGLVLLVCLLVLYKSKAKLNKKYLMFVRPFTLALIVVILLAVFIRLNLHAKQNNTISKQSAAPSSSGSYDKFKSYWVNEIKTEGATSAYKNFKNDYKNDDPVAQHLAAHFIGAILYETTGMSAITTCDSTFEYGCYHGSFIKAVEKDGIKIVPKLDNECIKKSSWPAACQHGIGHGLIEYFGYTDDGVKKSLAECDKLKNNNNLVGCSYGVLMGYEFPIGDDVKNLFSTRPANPNDPYEICNTLSGFDSQVCYYSMPQWWQLAYKTTYSHIVDLCSNVSKDADKKACYIGLGSYVAQLNTGSPKKTITTCNLIQDQKSQISCRMGGYWVMSNLMPERKAFFTGICNGLFGEESKECLGK